MSYVTCLWILIFPAKYKVEWSEVQTRNCPLWSNERTGALTACIVCCLNSPSWWDSYDSVRLPDYLNTNCVLSSLSPPDIIIFWSLVFSLKTNFCEVPAKLVNLIIIQISVCVNSGKYFPSSKYDSLSTRILHFTLWKTLVILSLSWLWDWDDVRLWEWCGSDVIWSPERRGGYRLLTTLTQNLASDLSLLSPLDVSRSDRDNLASADTRMWYPALTSVPQLRENTRETQSIF